MLVQVKTHLRIALTFSFVGDGFRDRLRAFPALVNCTTIDWFTAWPEDALQAVAHQYLASQAGISAENMKQLPQLCMKFHRTAQAVATQFLQQEKRHFYVTPTSYLELLLAYRSMLASRQEEVSSLRARYMGGLEKLSTTAASVEQMQTDLIALQPQLEEAKACCNTECTCCTNWPCRYADMYDGCGTGINRCCNGSHCEGDF